MKKSNFKYLVIGAVATIGVVAVTMFSCEKEVITPNSASNLKTEDVEMPVPKNYCGKVIEKDLINVDNQVVGKALIYNDFKYYHVILNTQKGYYMQDAYMHICSKIKELPLDQNSNPFVNKFTYSIKGRTLSNVREFKVPVGKLDQQSFVAVNAQIRKIMVNANEDEKNVNLPDKYVRAWVDGPYFGATEKGRYFNFSMEHCETLKPTPVVVENDNTSDPVTVNE
jgi:hypothetical protein